MLNYRSLTTKRLLVWGPIVLVILVNIGKELYRVWKLGNFRLVQWQMGIFYALFALGCWVGYQLVDLDSVLRRFKVSNPSLDPIMKNWSKAVRNVLTCACIALAGIWVISSSGSALGWGVVLGLQLRLFTELLGSVDYTGWYWVFNRSFSFTEHKVFLLAWTGALIAQVLILI